MLDPQGSIDGLGLTFQHLSADGKLEAIFRKQALALSEEQRKVISDHLKSGAKKSDKVEEVLRAAIGEK